MSTRSTARPGGARKPWIRPAALIGAACLLLPASGCGGGGDHVSSAAPTPTPTPILLPPLPGGQESPASGTLTLAVTSPSADSNTNASPAAGQVTAGGLGTVGGTPRSVVLTATNGSEPGSSTYAFSLVLSAQAGLRAGATYTVGASGDGALGVTYSEYPTSSTARKWAASPNGGVVTIDSLSADSVTLHGSTLMRPDAASSGTAAGSFVLDFSGTVTVPPP